MRARDNESATSTQGPGNTEAERFENAVKKIFSVSKEELLKREAEWQRTHPKKQGAK